MTTKFRVQNWLHGDGCSLICSVYTSYVRGGMFTLAASMVQIQPPRQYPIYKNIPNLISIRPRRYLSE